MAARMRDFHNRRGVLARAQAHRMLRLHAERDDRPQIGTARPVVQLISPGQLRRLVEHRVAGATTRRHDSAVRYEG
jgi:hypothetical protein